MCLNFFKKYASEFEVKIPGQGSVGSRESGGVLNGKERIFLSGTLS